MDSQALSHCPDEEFNHGYLVLPHNLQQRQTKQNALADLPSPDDRLCQVSEWWVEKCLHRKVLLDPIENTLCQPFQKSSVQGTVMGELA